MNWEFRTNDIYADADHKVYLQRKSKRGLENSHLLEYNPLVSSVCVAFYYENNDIVVDFEPGLTHFTSIIKAKKENFYVCCKGQLHYFSPNSPQTSTTFNAISILLGMEYIEGANILVCWDSSDFFTINESKILWGNARVSYDGIKDVSITSSRISGKGWSAPKDAFLPFELDLKTGKLLTNPIY